jgi:hypothetical protein
MDYFEINLSTEELWFLMKPFFPAQVLGMENPQLGWLAEEIEQADREAVEHLSDQGYVRIQSENSLEIDDVLYKIIKTIVRPDHTLIVQQGTPVAKPAQHYIHYREDLIIDHVELADGNHQIIALQDQAALLESLGIETGVNGKEKPAGKPFNLPEEILYQAAGEYSQGNNQAGEEMLKESNLKKEDIKSLHEALSRTLMNRSFVIVKNQNKPDKMQVSGFGILQGHDNLWLLQPVNQMGKSMIHFLPASMGMVTEKLQDILPC